MSERLLTLPQVAAALACSTRTLRRRIEAGALPVFRDGGLLRVRELDLARYVAARTAKPPARLRRMASGRPSPSSPRPPSRTLFDEPDPLISLPVRSTMVADHDKRPGDA